MSLTTEEILYMEEHIDESMQPEIYASTITCLVLSYLFVGLRLISRWLKNSRIEVDDWWAIGALFFTTVFVSMVWVSTGYGLGKHIITVTNTEAFAKSLLSTEVLYNPAIFCIKMSIISLYYRIFGFPYNTFRKVLIGLGFFIAAYLITAAFADIFQCVPVSSNWDPTVTPYCINFNAELIILSAINVLTDFALLFLPMPMLWSLHTTTARKLELTGMFMLGGFVTVVAIVKSYYVGTASKTDVSYDDSKGVIWTVVETCIGLVSACLPTLRPLVSWIVYGHTGGDTIPTMQNSGKSSFLSWMGSKSSGSQSQTQVSSTMKGNEQYPSYMDMNDLKFQSDITKITSSSESTARIRDSSVDSQV